MKTETESTHIETLYYLQIKVVYRYEFKMYCLKICIYVTSATTVYLISTWLQITSNAIESRYLSEVYTRCNINLPIYCNLV